MLAARVAAPETGRRGDPGHARPRHRSRLDRSNIRSARIDVHSQTPRATSARCHVVTYFEADRGHARARHPLRQLHEHVREGIQPMTAETSSTVDPSAPT